MKILQPGDDLPQIVANLGFRQHLPSFQNVRQRLRNERDVSVARTFVTRFHRLEKDVNSTHPSTAVFEQDVDVIFVLEVMVEVNYVLVVQGFVQFDLSINLRNTSGYYDCSNATGRKCDKNVKSSYLFSLVGFGHTRVGDDFGRVHFPCAQICEFVAFGKTALR